MSKRIVCWFSCGAASAVATKLAIKKHGTDNLYIGYQDTGSEHPDNRRFLKDCEEWFGVKVNIMKSKEYDDMWQVFEKRRYICGVAGAPCTSELKRKPAEDFLNFGKDREVFGYTADEQPRINRFVEQNPERDIYAILAEEGLDKENCMEIILKAGIKLPVMYSLGFPNNNCIGCVKGGKNYWMRIRSEFPEVFDRMARLERKLNAAINKKYVNEERIKVFLDELPEGDGDLAKEKPIQCGLFCGTNLE